MHPQMRSDNQGRKITISGAPAALLSPDTILILPYQYDSASFASPWSFLAAQTTRGDPSPFASATYRRFHEVAPTNYS